MAMATLITSAVSSERADGCAHSEVFVTTDPATARRFFSEAYNPRWQLTGLPSGCVVHHTRRRAGPVWIDIISVQGNGRLVAWPTDDTVVVLTPLHHADGIPGAAREPSVATPDVPYAMDLDNVSLSVVNLDAAVLRRAAVELAVPVPQQIRFLGHRAHSPELVEIWLRTIEYTEALLSAAHAMPNSPAVRIAVRTLAATALEYFHTNIAGCWYY